LTQRGISVTCLGSGGALCLERLWSSLLVDGRILLSLPPTAVAQMHRVGVRPEAIDYIFISHRHADHFFGLPFFLLLFAFTLKRTEPLYIIGPAGMEQASRELYKLAWPENGKTLHVPLRYVEVDEEGRYEAGALAFDAVRMAHFGMDAFGYRFACGDRIIAFTGDTGDGPQVDRLLRGVDVLITEFTYPDDTPDEGHMNAVSVARVASLMRARGGTVLATHLSGHPAPVPGVTLCREGETYVV
jgi:ribonuclease BN (tRNA processing enzyme)